MSMDFAHGLHYPYYVISAWVEFFSCRKVTPYDNGWDNELIVLLRTENKDEAYEVFKKTRLTKYRRQINLDIDTGEDRERLLTKDESGTF